MEDDTLDFNFWPSFADLMLALVLILVLVVFLVTAVITVGTVNLSHVENNQMNMISSIASAYSSEPKELEKGVFGISINVPNNYDIQIRNEPTLQRITFSDKILFKSDDYVLNDVGEQVLRIVSASLKRQLPIIREIQIQGHADNDRTGRFQSNVHLAAFRSIEVFKFLQDSAGIDPAKHLMSATSFGEFKRVQRGQGDIEYSQEDLLKSNSTPELKAKNRRIELLLFYRL